MGTRTSFAAAFAALATWGLLGGGGMVTAAPITVFNTGVNAAGTPLPDGTIGDPHYTLISVPAGSVTTIRVRTSGGGFPIPPWIGDNAVSAWIGPNNDIFVDGPIGDYRYRTTFDLTGLNPATAQITGQWASDNGGPDILLNGVSTGNATASEFTAFTPFTVLCAISSHSNAENRRENEGSEQ